MCFNERPWDAATVSGALAEGRLCLKSGPLNAAAKALVEGVLAPADAWALVQCLEGGV